ncbi:MAG: glycosyltransferase [Methanomassiliicoccales archaeon]|jgi:mannosyltransferase OCH1-like enzyme
MLIPKILHFVWIGPHPLPEWADYNIRLFAQLNPDYEIIIHGTELLTEDFRHAYDRVEGEHEWARRSDVLRICALLDYGGWYFDCDFLPIRPISDIETNGKAFIPHAAYLGGQPWLSNAIIGTTKDNPFLQLVANAIKRRAKDRKPLSWGSYGPIIFTEFAHLFPEYVHVGNIDDFYRIQDAKEARRIYQLICSSEKDIGEYLGLPLPIALHMGMQDETVLKSRD